ncbi:hypothetical protein FGB62_261g04 [Gracilaria domingensis]|nr:hypothetical protein FGB62_261g04 [Gracilaria domingensis]
MNNQHGHDDGRNGEPQPKRNGQCTVRGKIVDDMEQGAENSCADEKREHQTLEHISNKGRSRGAVKAIVGLQHKRLVNGEGHIKNSGQQARDGGKDQRLSELRSGGETRRKRPETRVDETQREKGGEAGINERGDKVEGGLCATVRLRLAELVGRHDGRQALGDGECGVEATVLTQRDVELEGSDEQLGGDTRLHVREHGAVALFFAAEGLGAATDQNGGRSARRMDGGGGECVFIRAHAIHTDLGQILARHARRSVCHNNSAACHLS